MVKLVGGGDTVFGPMGKVFGEAAGPTVFRVFVDPSLGFGIEGGKMGGEVIRFVHHGNIIRLTI